MIGGWQVARLQDVYEITRDLSEISNDELNACPHSRFDILEDLRKAIEAGNAYTGTIDGEPVSLFWFDTSQRPFVTSFIAANAYFQHYRVSVRKTRQALEQISAERGNVSFISLTRSPHPAVARWFKAIGMSPLDDNLFVFSAA